MIFNTTTKALGATALALFIVATGAAPRSASAQITSETTNEAAFEAQRLARGQSLVEEHCARCHAIGAKGDSPHEDAPPFRQILAHYPSEALAEAFAEGIETGHPDMPAFIFEPEEIGLLLDYLESVAATNPPAHTP